MKSGFAAIIGRPSAGKSTILNALCGEKVAITSPVPQTTRNSIRGIINRNQGQIVFLDTPGYHESDKKLNIYLKDVVHRTLSDADLVLYVVDASRSPGREEQAVMDLLAQSGKTVIAALNKVDLKTPLLQEIRGFVQVNLQPAAILEVSAVEGKNLEAMVDALFSVCPEGEAHYPADFYTDQNPEFRITEIIREQAISRAEKEVPHALYVEIVDMEFQKDDEESNESPAPGNPSSQDSNPPAQSSETIEVSASDDAPAPPGAPAGFFNDTDQSGTDLKTEKRKTLWVRAFLVVESKSQVGILVGHQGKKIRSIRIGALKEMKKIFPWKVRLDLRVKVNPKWRKKDPLLKRMLGPDA